MKKKFLNVIFILIFLAGLSLVLYPSVSNQWNTYRQSRLIAGYEEVVREMETEDFTGEWERAECFNKTLGSNVIYGDAFGIRDKGIKSTEYWKVLNIADDGVMGYLSIPKIHIKLAIYHGTEEEVLQTGIGHMNGTALPIGGEGTHCVLAAHRGLPSARLFTDIDQLQKGDEFYIHVLNETLAYQVDQVLDMIDKNDVDALEDALSIEEEKDYVTLFTCTPYGVNSHRLLVRGSRIPYQREADSVEQSISGTMLESVQNYYMIYTALGLSVTVLLIIIMKLLQTTIERRTKECGKK